jgi:hypothetical protein
VKNSSLLLYLLGLLLLGACQSGAKLSDEWQSLKVDQHFEVDYQSKILAGGDWPENQLDESLNDVPSELESLGSWAIRPIILKLSREAAVRLLPEALDGQAGQMSSEIVAHTLKTMVSVGDAVVLWSPRLAVYDRTRASLAIQNQKAFIQSFGLQQTSDAFLADPEVGVFRDGFKMIVGPSSLGSSGTGTLSFEIEWSELLTMKEVQSRYPNSADPMTMQVPVYAMQHISGSFDMANGRASYMPAITTSDGQIVLIFFEAKLMLDQTSAQREPSFDQAFESK